VYDIEKGAGSGGEIFADFIFGEVYVGKAGNEVGNPVVNHEKHLLNWVKLYRASSQILHMPQKVVSALADYPYRRVRSDSGSLG